MMFCRLSCEIARADICKSNFRISLHDYSMVFVYQPALMQFLLRPPVTPSALSPRPHVGRSAGNLKRGRDRGLVFRVRCIV